jgi:FixJ family two-component response regulator
VAGSQFLGSAVLSPTIIVIAADAGLRKSLVFALEVEGYEVQAHEAWQGWPIHIGPRFCMIIDGDLIDDGICFLERIPQDHNALIVLDDGLAPVLSSRRADILTKPFAGADLLHLVKNRPATPDAGPAGKVGPARSPVGTSP